MLQSLWSLVPIPLKDTMPVKAFAGTASNGSPVHAAGFEYTDPNALNSISTRLIESGNNE